MEAKQILHNFMGHLSTVNAHKWMVLKHCFRVGLYKQGILHDMSKYSFTEFIPGVKYYRGYCSPNNIQRNVEGRSTAWLHHKGRNKHHYEYWIDYTGNREGTLEGMKMPVNYVVEMFCDRVAACKIYHKENYTDGDPLAYFMKGKDHYIIHPEAKELLNKLLVMLKEKGEKETFLYIKKEVLKKGEK